MTNNAERRLMKDLKKIQKEQNDDSITAIPDEDSIFNWTAIIMGPDDTEWEGGIFKLRMKFSD
jgi:ubiquitin-conjugating enzyme E2 A